MRPGNDGGSVILERNVQRGEEFDEVALAIGALTGGSVGLDPSAASPGEVAQFDALATWLIMQGSVDADVELTVEEVQILQRAIAATEKKRCASFTSRFTNCV